MNPNSMVFILEITYLRKKDGAYIINQVIILDEYKPIGTHWVAIYIKNEITTYFDSFGVEHVPKDKKSFYVIKLLKLVVIEYKDMIQ